MDIFQLNSRVLFLKDEYIKTLEVVENIGYADTNDYSP